MHMHMHMYMLHMHMHNMLYGSGTAPGPAHSLQSPRL